MWLQQAEARVPGGRLQVRVRVRRVTREGELRTHSDDGAETAGLVGHRLTAVPSGQGRVRTGSWSCKGPSESSWEGAGLSLAPVSIRPRCGSLGGRPWAGGTCSHGLISSCFALPRAPETAVQGQRSCDAKLGEPSAARGRGEGGPLGLRGLGSPHMPLRTLTSYVTRSRALSLLP